MRNFFPIILAVLICGCVSKTDHSAVLARFDGTTITQNQFNKKVESLPKSVQEVARRRKKEFVKDMAVEHFLMKEADRQGLEKQADVQDLVKQARKKIILAKLIENEVDRRVTVRLEEVSQYYEFHKEEFMTPLLLKASHILVKTPEEADQIKKELEAGADFEELARKKSLDSTAIRGGDLGFFQKGRFVPEFEDAVFKMKKGELSGVIQTQFGCHVIKLTDRLEPTLRDFRAVKPLVEERLLNEKRSKAFKAFVEKLEGSTKIEFDEKALSS